MGCFYKSDKGSWQNYYHFKKIIWSCQLLCKETKVLPQHQQDKGSREDILIYA